MFNSKLLNSLLLLIAGGLIGFFAGRNFSNAPSPVAPIAVNTEVPKPPTPPVPPPIEEPIAETTPEVKPEPVSEPEKPSAAKPGITSTLASMGCFTDEAQLSQQLSLYAEELERQQIPYNNWEPEKLQDCSGIFHRTSQFVNSKCDQFQYPDVKKTRSTGTLAKWFNDNNNLVVIDDPLTKRHFIKPGSVMFFGGSGKFYKPTEASVTATGAGKIIAHVGVVTEVKRNEAGEVIGYVMFHGRRPGKTAQRSHYHSVEPPRIGYPVLGNWNQQWVAVANIMTPES